jgi:hypothetical protein
MFRGNFLLMRLFIINLSVSELSDFIFGQTGEF